MPLGLGEGPGPGVMGAREAWEPERAFENWVFSHCKAVPTWPQGAHAPFSVPVPGLLFHSEN